MAFQSEDVRVLVADDHVLYRRGLITELDDADHLEVVAEAGSGEEAVESASALTPDVILMDVRMPGIGGIEATRRLVELIPSTRVLMLSVSDDDEDLFEAVKAGAVGYLLKETSIVDVAEAVRRVAAGHSFVSPQLAGKLLVAFADISRWLEPCERQDRNPAPLTSREVEVLQSMAEGADNCSIGAAVGLSEHSVRNHVRNILEKLHLHSRTEAVLYAARTAIIDP